MRTYTTLEYPPIEEAFEAMEKNSPGASSIATEFLLKCLIISETNHLRATDPDKKYRLNGWRSKTYRLWDGIITIPYPRFKGHEEVYPFKAFEIAEELEARFKLDVSLDYILGDSDRKLSLKFKKEGSALSKSSVSDYYREMMQNNLSYFRTRSLSGKTYINLQYDAMWVSVRELYKPKSKYEKVALLRGIGLDRRTLAVELIDLMVVPSESTLAYQLFFEEMVRRGLGEVYIITTDAHKSFPGAIASVFFNVEEQICRFHFQKKTSVELRKDMISQLKLDSKKHKQAINHAIVKLFRSIYDDIPDFETSLKRTRYLLNCLHFSDERRKEFNEGARKTRTYLNYPKGLSSEISTTNQTERYNLEDRRRFNEIGGFPNNRALLRLSLGIGLYVVDSWSEHTQCTREDALEAYLVYRDTINKAYSLVKDCTDSYHKLTKASLAGSPFKALWCNVFSIPIPVGHHEPLIGVLAVHGVTQESATRLIYLSPLKDRSKESFKIAAEQLLKQGLDPNQIDLIIQGTFMFPGFQGFLDCFPKSKLLLHVSTILDQLDLLAWGLKDEVKNEFIQIFASKSQREGLERLEAFKEKLKELKLYGCLNYIELIDPKSLVEAVTKLKKKEWSHFDPFEFKLYPHWIKRLKILNNHPKTAKKAVKDLYSSLKRKKMKRTP